MLGRLRDSFDVAGFNISFWVNSFLSCFNLHYTATSSNIIPFYVQFRKFEEKSLLGSTTIYFDIFKIIQNEAEKVLQKKMK